MAGRNALLVAHRVLIALAIGLSVALLAHGVAMYVKRGDGASLATGIAALLVGMALAFYLRWFGKKHRAQ